MKLPVDTKKASFIGAFLAIITFVIVLYYKHSKTKNTMLSTTNQDKDLTRGQRNNNPLNIKKSSDKWKGSIGDDGVFVKFQSVEYGLRAAIKLIKTYNSKYHLNTVEKIIKRWAPANVDNNSTSNYIKFVSRDMKVNPTTVLNLLSYSQMFDLVAAMSVYESKMRPTLAQMQIANRL